MFDFLKKNDLVSSFENRHIFVGKLGEDLAERFLILKGHIIVCRNFRTRNGEIDIISKKLGKAYFWEVKTVSHENIDGIRPEDNLHKNKLMRLDLAIKYYLLKNNNFSSDFCVNAIIINVNNLKKTSKIKILENIL